MATKPQTAAPGATSVGTASSSGSAKTYARSDHVHQSNTAPATTTKAAAAIGTSGEPARADHKHDVSTAAPAIGIGGGNAEGSATSVARSDHNHAIRTTTGPTDLTVGAIVDGEFLKRVGTTITSAAVAAGGGFTQVFDANLAIFPSTNPAGATSRNGHPLLTFDQTTGETVTFHSAIPNAYQSGSSLTVRIDWVAASPLIAGDVRWGIEFERLGAGGQNITVDGFAAQKTVTSTTSGTNGVITRSTITFTNAEADALAAGDAYRMRLARVTGIGGNLAGDAQVLRVTVLQ